MKKLKSKEDQEIKGQFNGIHVIIQQKLIDIKRFSSWKNKSEVTYLKKGIVKVVLEFRAKTKLSWL